MAHDADDGVQSHGPCGWAEQSGDSHSSTAGAALLRQRSVPPQRGPRPPGKARKGLGAGGDGAPPASAVPREGRAKMELPCHRQGPGQARGQLRAAWASQSRQGPVTACPPLRWQPCRVMAPATPPCRRGLGHGGRRGEVVVVARAPRSPCPRAGCQGTRQAGRAQSTAVSLYY